ncbi:MAG TPA: hypothetical protein VHV08_18020 [Pirellulales bacterium]|nr:hypothetical protein [Pirellulales bacterium]
MVVDQTEKSEEDESDVDEPRVVAKSLPSTPAPRKLLAEEPSEQLAPRAAKVEAEQLAEEKAEKHVVEKFEKHVSADEGRAILFTGQSPSLAVEVAGPRRVLIGKESQFVVKIVNSGATANDVVVAVNIPSNVEVVSVQASSGAAQAPVAGEQREPLQWKIGRLEGKSTETLHLRLVPRKSSPLDLAVQWSFTPETSQALVEVQEPKLSMVVSGPDEILFGQSKMYKLTVSNPGNGDCENVIVGLLPIAGAGESQASHRLGALRAGESKTIDVELTARQSGAITIKAQAFADGGLRCESAEQVLVRRANLLIEVEAPKVKYAGTVGNYHIKVVNAGNAGAENVHVAALLPPGSKYVASSGGGRLEPQQGKIKWTVGTLPAGGERRFEMQCSLASPGENRMQFITMADGDLNALAMSSTRVEALADLKLEVRDPQGPIAVGDETVYEVCIRNRGTKAADGVDLTVFFSAGLEAISVEGGPHDIGPGQVVFKPIAALPAGETVVYRVHARAEKGGNHVFRAEVACHSLNTKLATEETTRFYGDESTAESRSSDLDESQAAAAPAPLRSAANDPPDRPQQ